MLCIASQEKLQVKITNPLSEHWKTKTLVFDVHDLTTLYSKISYAIFINIIVTTLLVLVGMIESKYFLTFPKCSLSEPPSVIITK